MNGGVLITSASVARVSEAVHGVSYMDEARLQAGKQLFARRRQCDRSHAPLEQLQAEQVLEPADLVTQRARRHAQLLRGLGQAEMAGSGLECA